MSQTNEPVERRKFGHQMRKHFLFDEEYLNLNHASFGTYPRAVRDVFRTYQDRSEARPDPFLRYDYPKLLDESRTALASLINAPSDTIVMLQNATTGINTVLRNLVFKPGDVILYLASIYGACEKTIHYITETTPAEAVKITFSFPVSDEWIVDEFQRVIAEEKGKSRNVKVAIFDTICSMPGIRLPFERLTELCRKEEVLSCIDGAHGVGQLPLDMTKLDPDFFVSNCHKWLYVPRGCAVFYVPVRNQHLMRSALPTSHGFVPKLKPGQNESANPLPAAVGSAFVNLFSYVATLDYCPNLCVPAALAFRSDILGGEEAIQDYCSDLAVRAGSFTALHFGTEVLEEACGKSTRDTSLANIRLPISVSDVGEDNIVAVRQWMETTLVNEHNTFIQIYFHGQAFWVRWSAQVYLELSDFEWGARIVKEVCERAKNGEWKARDEAKSGAGGGPTSNRIKPRL